MLVAFYFGDHKSDGWRARLGYSLIRLGQISEPYGDFTHCEALFNVAPDGWCTIGSASVRDGNQVRLKQTYLKKGRWEILDVPAYEEAFSLNWFRERSGVPYSMLGAVSSALWAARALLAVIRKDPKELGQWCSRAVPDSMGIAGGEAMSVSELCLCLRNLPGTRVVTEDFFSGVLFQDVD